VWDEKPSGVVVRECLSFFNSFKTEERGKKIVSIKLGGFGGQAILGIILLS